MANVRGEVCGEVRLSDKFANGLKRFRDSVAKPIHDEFVSLGLIALLEQVEDHFVEINVIPADTITESDSLTALLRRMPKPTSYKHAEQ